MKRIYKILLLLVISITVLAACTPSDNAESRTVVDQKGREIAIDGAVERIVSIAPSNTEILFELGLGDKVVGVSAFCNYPPETENIEKVGTFSEPNIELIIAAEPDVVFSTTISQESVEALDQAGIPVIVLDAKKTESIFDAIEIIGEACETVEEADQLVNDLQARITEVNDIVEGIADADKKTVFYEIWHDPPMTVGPNTFLSDVIVAAGGKNIAADADTDWPSYSIEEILSRDPDVILLGHGGQQVAEVAERTGWEIISAVKNNRVVAVDPDVFSRPGPRIVDAIQFLAEYMYPELFK